jgi:hypothetical protein
METAAVAAASRGEEGNLESTLAALFAVEAA